MRNRQWIGVLFCLPALLSAGLLGGCTIGGGGGGGNGNDNTPPPASVLAGDWATAAQAGGKIVVTFSSAGIVTQVVGTAVDGVSVTVNVTGATSSVNGSDVTFTIPLPDGDVTFEGTLSADENTLTGELSRNIQVGDNVIVTVPAGAVTLTRGTTPAPECETDADCAEGEACVNGECMAAAECEADADCAEGEACVDGECVAALDGAAIYANSCAGCHAADGSGNIGPDIRGKTAEELTTGLGSATHSSISLTAEEIAAVAGFLAQ